MYRSGWFICATMMTLPLAWTASAQAGGADTHRQALELHRAGQPEAAVPILQTLRRQYPSERRYLYDLINALAATGRDEEALALREAAGPRPPAYVLEALAKAARHRGEYTLARELYRQATQVTPQRAEPWAGEILTLADDRQPGAGVARYHGLSPTLQHQPALRLAYAYALWRAERPREALAVYQQILADHPASHEARRGRLLMLARLGLPWTAEALSQQAPTLLRADERQWLNERLKARPLPKDEDWTPLQRALPALFEALAPPRPCDCAGAAAAAELALRHGGSAETYGLLLLFPERTFRHPLLLERLAQAALAAGHPIDALRASETWLSLAPGARGAERLRLQALADLGAAYETLQQAESQPGVLDAEELATLRLAAARQVLTWQETDDEHLPGKRYRSVDHALALLTPLEQDARHGLQARMLKLVALRDRVRMEEAAALYDQLAAEGRELPAEVLAAAADAELYLERPERARELYLAALGKRPDLFDARMGLYYAYLEDEDYPKARATLEETLAREPEVLYPEHRDLRRPNPNHRTAQAAWAMFLAYDEQHDAALRAQHDLLMQAAMDSGVRNDRATVFSFRGWPRRSLAEFEWILAVHPNDLRAKVGRATQRLALGEFEASLEERDRLLKDRPEFKPIQRLDREWRAFERPEWILEAQLGQSSNPAFSGQQDYRLESWLYSQPWALHTRLFLHGYTSAGDYPEGTIDYTRWGVGLEQRWRDWSFSLEGHRSDLDGQRDGVAANVTWTPSDHWRISLGHDSNSLAAPLRARAYGLSAQSTTLDLTWQAHESRSLGVSLGYHDFSDGNQRTTLLAAWEERLHARAHHQLSARLDLYTSRNTAEERPYFNPSQDASVALTLSYDWLTWRRYERAFRQRIALTVGDYWQEDFGHGLLAGARYEHEWTLHPRLSLVYGIRYLRHPYDGEYDDRTALYLRLDTRF